jgi:uncharacterized MAPEG superfamily protein
VSNLEFYTGLTGLWVAIAWLPYILDRIMVRGLIGGMANYDANATPQSAWAQRAQRAHTVAIEAFAAFGPLAVMAMIKLPDDSYPGTLAMTFFIGIVAHYIIYCIGIPVLRTLAFALAALSTVALALRLIGWI